MAQKPTTDGGRIDAPDFAHAAEVGEVLEKGGYHQPASRGAVDCGCALTTAKGAYRYVTVRMPDGRTVYYYHQTPVVTEANGSLRLESAGWLTRTTKREINDHTPRGVRVDGPCRMRRRVETDGWGPGRYEIREGGPWTVTLPDGSERDFEDGMVITP